MGFLRGILIRSQSKISRNKTLFYVGDIIGDPYISVQFLSDVVLRINSPPPHDTTSIVDAKMIKCTKDVIDEALKKSIHRLNK